MYYNKLRSPRSEVSFGWPSRQGRNQARFMSRLDQHGLHPRFVQEGIAPVFRLSLLRS
ncbi:MAG: hypothetical protein ACI841_000004 [Planctomycetota bacterium]|jgi:hypothetical protein